MFILGLAGFKERVPGQPPILTQPDSSLLAIRIIMALAPLILLGIGSLISLSYRIDAKEQQKLKEQISLQDDEPINAESLS